MELSWGLSTAPQVFPYSSVHVREKTTAPSLLPGWPLPKLGSFILPVLLQGLLQMALHTDPTQACPSPSWGAKVLLERESIAILLGSWAHWVTTLLEADNFQTSISFESLISAKKKHIFPQWTKIYTDPCYA